MKKIALWAGAAVPVLAGGLFAYPRRSAHSAKTICPLTGQEIDGSQCPLIDPDRPDCPGKIECP